MKKIIYLLLITVLFTACKKKKNVNPQPVDPQFANQNCQISKIELTGSDGSVRGTIIFNYDDKGNLVKAEDKVEVKKGVLESHTYTYAYSKQRIVRKQQSSEDDGTEITTYSLDDSGKIISAEEIISNATASATTRNITYQYAGDGYLSDIITQDKVSGDVIKNTYTWQNGNLTSMKEQTFKNNIIFYTGTKSYEYGTDVWPVTFLFLDMIMTDDEADPFLRKYFGKLPKNLPSREIEKYETLIIDKYKTFEFITEYAYQKDSKGNVTKFSAVQKNPQEKGKDESFSAIFHYNCK